MKSIKLLKYFLLTVIIAFSSCDSLLDKQFDDTLSDTQILRDPSLVMGLQTAIYNYMPRNDFSYNIIGGAMLDCATDDGMESSGSSDIHNMTNGAWSPYKTIDDQWWRLYSGIRKCYLFFKYIDQSTVSNNIVLDANGKPTENSQLRERLKAETVFLNALFYFELIKRYGNVPLVTSILPPDTAMLDIPRTPYNVIVDSIVKWCDHAATVLPLVYSDGAKGHATKGAALMLKSRTLLYAASPLNNPTNDKGKWRLAAEAAKAVIDLSENNANLYVLNASFAAPFSTPFDKEIIMPGKYYNRNDIEFNNVPNGYSKGKGHTNPTQNLVDAFEIKVNGVYVPYDPNDPTHEAKMYSTDRDPRLAATVLYNGATFKTRKVETFIGGLDGLNKTIDYTKTGYYLKKFVLPEISLDLGTATRPRAWILYRYAEALLNYAEAQNEYLDAPDASVYQRLSQVRVRSMGAAGNLVPSLGWTKDQMRARIQNECRVEFAYEEHRFWDVRRWKKGEELFNAPIYGISITKSSTVLTSTRFKVEDRIFSPQMYFCPISYYSVLKAPITGQTDSWK
ncbi:MAG TPA: RagB/SusD family nutrient uptake outer membrane protein [Paludibacter sp.]